MGVFSTGSNNSDKPHNSLIRRTLDGMSDKNIAVWSAGVLAFLFMPALAFGTDFKKSEQLDAPVNAESSQQSSVETMSGSDADEAKELQSAGQENAAQVEVNTNSPGSTQVKINGQDKVVPPSGTLQQNVRGSANGNSSIEVDVKNNSSGNSQSSSSTKVEINSNSNARKRNN